MHVKLVWPFIHLKSKRPQFGNNFSDNFFRQSNICSGILLHLKLHRSDWYSCQVPTHFYHIWCDLFLMCSFTTVWKTFDGACFRLLGRWENTLLLRTQSNLSKTVLEIFGLPTQLSTPKKKLCTPFTFLDVLEEGDSAGKTKPRSGSKSLDIGDYIGMVGGWWWAPLVPGGTSSLCLRNLRGPASSCRLHQIGTAHSGAHTSIARAGAQKDQITPCMIRPSCCRAEI